VTSLEPVISIISNLKMEFLPLPLITWINQVNGKHQRSIPDGHCDGCAYSDDGIIAVEPNGLSQCGIVSV
jgi:hypothetical protein